MHTCTDTYHKKKGRKEMLGLPWYIAMKERNGLIQCVKIFPLIVRILSLQVVT